MKPLVLLFLPIFSLINASLESSLRSYLDQKSWANACQGERQSPIDLPDICYQRQDLKVKLDSKLRLSLFSYDEQVRGKLTNNGHTVVLTPRKRNIGIEFASSSVKTPTNYTFTQFHFHWNPKDTKGSEHSVDGVRKALELHLVHFNSKYKSFEEASKKRDGLLVIRVLFQECFKDKEAYKGITDSLSKISKVGTTTDVTGFTLRSLLPTNFDTFYSYEGSLTTPPCSQTVTWIVMSEYSLISYKQLSEFQGLSAFDPDVGLTRETQPLNGRTIYASNDDYCGIKKTRKRGLQEFNAALYSVQ